MLVRSNEQKNGRNKYILKAKPFFFSSFQFLLDFYFVQIIIVFFSSKVYLLSIILTIKKERERKTKPKKYKAYLMFSKTIHIL